MFSPDLNQTLIDTFYNFFIHNYVILVYLLGTLITAILTFIKPSRFRLLIFLGFLILSFAYEYDKHLIEPLRTQTLESLLGSLQSTAHPKVNRLVDLVVSELIPIFSYIFGWLLIFVAIILGEDKHLRPKQPKPEDRTPNPQA